MPCWCQALSLLPARPGGHTGTLGGLGHLGQLSWKPLAGGILENPSLWSKSWSLAHRDPSSCFGMHSRGWEVADIPSRGGLARPWPPGNPFLVLRGRCPWSVLTWAGRGARCSRCGAGAAPLGPCLTAILQPRLSPVCPGQLCSEGKGRGSQELGCCRLLGCCQLLGLWAASRAGLSPSPSCSGIRWHRALVLEVFTRSV